MIVCECLALTDRQVQKRLDQGACRLSDLVPKAALEGSCGACFETLKKMIRESRVFVSKGNKEGPNDFDRSGL